MTPHPAFAKRIVLATIAGRAAGEAAQAKRSAEAAKLRNEARQHLEVAMKLSADPDEIAQLEKWAKRFERRGRKRKPKPQPPKTVEMFPPSPFDEAPAAAAVASEKGEARSA